MDDLEREFLIGLGDVNLPFAVWDRLSSSLKTVLVKARAEGAGQVVVTGGHADCDNAIRENHERMVHYRTAINDAINHLEKPGDPAKLALGTLLILREALDHD